MQTSIYRIISLLSILLLSGGVQAQVKNILINHGEEITNVPQVKLHLKYRGAQEMKLWNGLDSVDEASATWQQFRSEMPWNLPDGDGKKVISVRFRNEAGQLSEQYIDAITYDTQAPQIDSIKVGAQSITNVHLGITIKLYVQEVKEMMVSNDAGFKYAGWESYKKEFRWTLPTGDGEKKVYFKFRDKVGNTTEVVSESITLDTQAPSKTQLIIKSKDGISSADLSGALHINNKNRLVDLEIKAEGAVDMMVGNDVSFYGRSWQAYTDTLNNWKLTKEADGAHYVYVRFRDSIGNVSKATSARVVLDTQNPVLRSLKINKGDTITNNIDVELQLEGYGADLMQIANNPALKEAVSYKYSNKVSWKLDGEDGPLSVYVALLDSAQNVSDTVKATIILDTKPPTPIAVIIEGGEERIRTTQASVALKATEAAMMQVNTSPDFEKVRWTNYHENSFNIPIGDKKGTRWVYARFKDEAGNISETIQDSVISEEVPLFTKVQIDKDAQYCIHPEGEVSIQLDAVRATEMMVSNHPRFLRAEWEPFQTNFTWKLEGDEGEREVFVKVRSSTQTEAEVKSDKITWDRSKPHDCSIDINNGSISTFDHRITVEPKAQDAQYMQVGLDSSFNNLSWKYYEPNAIEMSVSKSPGWKRIYARFKDDKGNISPVVYDSILMEIKPVAGKIRIDGGAEFCTNPEKEVTLSIQAQHAAEMMMGSSPSFEGAVWEPFSTEKKWILAGEDDTKIVYLKFRSSTGTESDIYTDYIILDRKPPYDIKLEVSKTRAGEAIAPHHVYVGATATDAVAMQIRLDEHFSDIQTWHSYSDLSFLYSIGKKEGDLNVFVRFKDVAGNISEPVSKSITVDRTRPEDIFIGVEDGATSVNTTDITLELRATDATEMRFNTAPVFNDLPWEPFAATKAWTLAERDGTQAIYVQFRDAVGNTSRAAGTRVELDRDAPVGEFIQIKEDYCTNKQRIVHLKLRAYGSSKVLISHNPTFTDATWISYKAEMPWRLPEIDAEYTIYAKFSDEAGNETGVFTDKVILDREAPTGSVTINLDDTYTDKVDVNLSISTDNAQEMMISNVPNFVPASAWIPYAGAWSWRLNDGRDGRKDVYIKFRDAAGNESIAYMDSILLDRAGPVVKSFKINDGATAVKGKKVVLHSQVEGAKWMMVSNSPDFSGSVWEPYFEEKDWMLEGDEGKQNVYAKFKDHLDHETPKIFSDGIMVYKKLYYISK